MTTPDRYAWTVTDGVQDAHSRPRTIGIGEADGRVEYSLLDENGQTVAFCSVTPDAADQIWAATATAARRALKHGQS